MSLRLIYRWGNMKAYNAVKMDGPWRIVGGEGIDQSLLTSEQHFFHRSAVTSEQHCDHRSAVGRLLRVLERELIRSSSRRLLLPSTLNQLGSYTKKASILSANYFFAWPVGACASVRAGSQEEDGGGGFWKICPYK
jgi:hypothetical protein